MPLPFPLLLLINSCFPLRRKGSWPWESCWTTTSCLCGSFLADFLKFPTRSSFFSLLRPKRSRRPPFVPLLTEALKQQPSLFFILILFWIFCGIFSLFFMQLNFSCSSS